jgi:hypothetical protein
MKKILIVLSFLVCANVFAADQTNIDKKALQKPDKPAKIDGCCKVCKTGVTQPCGNACISLGKECGKGKGCACTPDDKHELIQESIWKAPKE